MCSFFARWIIVLYLLTFLPHFLTAQGGLVAEYFNDTELKNVVLTRIESKPYLNYYKERPAAGVNAEYFSARYTGLITAPVSGEYTFSISADDGVRLWINNTKLIDAWVEQEATSYTASITLEQDKKYKIKIEYYNSWLHSVLMLSWETPEDGISLFGYNFFRSRKEVPSSAYTVDVTETVVIKPAASVQPVNDKPAKTNSTIASSPANRTLPKKITGQQTRSDSLQSPIKERMIAVNEFIRLKSVRFVLSKAELLEGSFQELDTIANYMITHPALKIKIVGHADYEGDWTANRLLSKQRANAVADYFKSKGVVAERVVVEAMGASQPIVRDNNPQNREANRRVEFMLIPN